MKKFISVIIFMLVCMGLFNTPRTAAAQLAFEPRVEVLSAKQDLHVVIYAHGFPAFVEIQVTMSTLGAAAGEAIEITTINAEESGAFFRVVLIPAALKGEAQLNIFMEGIKNHYAAQATFNNETFVNEEATQNTRDLVKSAESASEETFSLAFNAEDVEDPQNMGAIADSGDLSPTVEGEASLWLGGDHQDPYRIDPVLFIWPAENRWLSGYDYSLTHPAIDIAASEDDFVFAAASGKVTITDYSSFSYGTMVKIDHQNGYETLYAHLNSILINQGDYVIQGQPIGLAGSTGNSTGPHLHFEIRYQWEFLNPWDFLN